MPSFDPDPEKENSAQIERWSLNAAPDWTCPPLAIANQYQDTATSQIKRERYRLVLVRSSNYAWIDRDRRREVQDGVSRSHPWIPLQCLPFEETVLYAYAADYTPHPSYICLPSGLYKARNGQPVARMGPQQEIIPLPGMYFFDGWRVQPTMTIPADLPNTKDMPVKGTPRAAAVDDKDPPKPPEEEARDILATAYKNQVENGPGTRRAAIRACKYLKAMVKEYGAVITEVHAAARLHTQKSKGAVAANVQYHPTGASLPVITPELTSELLHCLSAIPDPWPMAKITIDMEKPAQWVSKLSRLYFADRYARRTEGFPATTPAPAVGPTLDEIEEILPKLEARMIEFLAEWLVTLLIPATQVLETRAPHLSFMFLKHYWFRELYLGLKVTASLGRSESYTKIIDGQVRCITQDAVPKNLQVIWNVQFITIFVPAWMIPPIYHSLRRECIKNATHSREIGVKSVRPTWFEDSAIPQGPTTADHQAESQPMHGLKLVIKEEALPQEELPHFPALALLAERGLLGFETWNCKKEQVSFKATIDVPMLGSIIENNGDALDESHMPVGWPLSIDGAVRQFCSHKTATVQELDQMLKEYDMKRTSVEINRKASQWSHNSVWNRKYMEPTQGRSLRQMWQNSPTNISRKTTRSYDIAEQDLRRIVRELASLPPASAPESPFLRELGKPGQSSIPPQNATLMQRAVEEWERTICENKAVAILDQLQKGRPALIQEDGGEMLIAIVLDRPLIEAQALVEDPTSFLQEITKVLSNKQHHPVLQQMLRTIQDDTAKGSASSKGDPGERSAPEHDRFQ